MNSKAVQGQRSAPAWPRHLDPDELARLREVDRKTRLAFASIRRSADAALRQQRR